MAGDITTWNGLVACKLAATVGTLELYVPYVLIQAGQNGSLTLQDHIVFYGGPSKLTQTLPRHKNLERPALLVGEMIVPVARQATGSHPLPCAAILYGLAGPRAYNPLHRVWTYACIRPPNVKRLVFSKEDAHVAESVASKVA